MVERNGKSNRYLLYIHYERRKTQSFKLKLDAETLQLVSEHSGSPAWTKLSFHQCNNCPLDESTHNTCPAALSLVDLVTRCEELVSYDQIDVRVVTDEWTITQRAISALMGLIMATSGCPKTAYLKPMARFHLPLASEDEAVYRVTSMYLLAQYFLKLEVGPLIRVLTD